MAIVQTLRKKASRITHTVRRPRVKKAILVAAALLLLCAVLFAVAANPDLLLKADITAILIVLFLGVPASVLANVSEFQKFSNLLGRKFRYGDAFRITIVSSAANLLPIPGATLVRIAVLKSKHVSARSVMLATVLVAGAWLSITLLVTGVVGIGYVAPSVASTLVLAGVAGFAAASAYSVWAFRSLWAWIELALSKFVLVGCEAFRIYFCLVAVGGAPSLFQVASLLPSSVIGSAISLVPAGLGVREAVGALIAPLVSLDAAMVLVAMTLNRLLGLMIVAPAAAFIASRGEMRSVSLASSTHPQDPSFPS